LSEEEPMLDYSPRFYHPIVITAAPLIQHRCESQAFCYRCTQSLLAIRVLSPNDEDSRGGYLPYGKATAFANVIYDRACDREPH